MKQRWPDCPWESYLNVHKCGILLQNLTVCICLLPICSEKLQVSVISKNVTKNFSQPNTDINQPHFLCHWFTRWEILSSPVNAPIRNNLSLWLQAEWWPNKNYEHWVPFYRNKSCDLSRPPLTMTDEWHEQDSHRSTVRTFMSSWLQWAIPMASIILCNVQFKVQIITESILISWQFFKYKHICTPI